MQTGLRLVRQYFRKTLRDGISENFTWPSLTVTTVPCTIWPPWLTAAARRTCSTSGTFSAVTRLFTRPSSQTARTSSACWSSPARRPDSAVGELRRRCWSPAPDNYLAVSDRSSDLSVTPSVLGCRSTAVMSDCLTTSSRLQPVYCGIGPKIRNVIHE